VGGAVTRYCYDEFGLLRCVVQPEGTSPSQTQNCFYYKYDERQRLTDKRIPGKGWKYFIYDERDRLVLSQDAMQRAKTPDEWSYIIYDAQNRPSEKGIWASYSSRSTLESAIESNINYMSSQGSRVELKEIYYDSYSGLNVAYAMHDDADTLGVTQALCDTGRVTWENTKLLDYEAGMDYWITTAYYYDKYGRLIQTVSDNHLNGKDYITNSYNFTGQVTRTRYRHVADGTTT
jgi:hypothetical protein